METLQESLIRALNTTINESTKDIIDSISKDKDMEELLSDKYASKVIKMCVEYFDRFVGDLFRKSTEEEQCEDIMGLYSDILMDYDGDMEDIIKRCKMKDIGTISDSTGRNYNYYKYDI